MQQLIDITYILATHGHNNCCQKWLIYQLNKLVSNSTKINNTFPTNTMSNWACFRSYILLGLLEAGYNIA